jgi:hypothetical protein
MRYRLRFIARGGYRENGARGRRREYDAEERDSGAGVGRREVVTVDVGSE